LQFDHLPCFDNPPFRLPNPSFKLRPSDLSFSQFHAPRLKISPQLRHCPLSIAH
jgi:hypothetical protein